MSGVYIGVDGKARKIKGSYIGIDGKARKIKKGYIGDENGVARLCWTSGTPVGELPVGETIYLPMNDGTNKEVIIIHQGLPSDVYDSSCDGTWVLAEYDPAYSWGYLSNNYQESKVHQNTKLNDYKSFVQSAIKSVKIPYTDGSGSGGTLRTGTNGLSAKMFALSCRELGLYNSDSNDEGSVLDYFTSGTNSRVIGASSTWWLRSPNTSTSNRQHCITTAGALTDSYVDNSMSRCLVLACVISPSTLVDDTFTFIGS
jgi:hypothetical protein